MGFIGPAEAVPLLQSLEESALQGVLQGLKPDIDLIDFIGPAEAVPLLLSLEESALQGVFPQPVKLIVCYQQLRHG